MTGMDLEEAKKILDLSDKYTSKEVDEVFLF
jgi:hypothetical protein